MGIRDTLYFWSLTLLTFPVSLLSDWLCVYCVAKKRFRRKKGRELWLEPGAMETITRPTEEQMFAEEGVTMAKEEELGSPKDHAPNPPPDRPTVETKVVQSVRKDIPPKKDRLEPLKIDMSKHFLLPPTSAQLSLQCLDCHIIFSDHKSKERHLKQSHPAEYEQCMLGDALFACYVCDRHFTCSSELMAHQRTHTEKQPFKCPICGRPSAGPPS
ncbi:hypothetical protein AGOR_G00212720 [Albula goreensis]|uniref:C2H2-type domain-containing protein n=1 Tax=Albula goreensis TaxID=1534307 RepID=A0A8T3CSS7_9TELE|nr:hypothetical protein AGOR_G00212720 [Albula goreensis]